MVLLNLSYTNSLKRNETNHKTVLIPILAFLLTAILLSIVQLKVERPIILAERFVKNAGWFEILVLALYAAIVVQGMQDITKTAKWRKISWMIFSIVFFLQLIIGLSGFEKFLMTGKLHFPIPALIIGGPIYRADISFMPILFLSTIILTGPAWCSHLCYFGAFDNIASNNLRRKDLSPIKNKFVLKSTFILIVIISALIFRLFQVNVFYVIIFSSIFGIAGVFVIILISAKQKRMIHCTVYCPVGTVVNFLKYVNPFRMSIDDNCTECMRCISYCKYDALNKTDIQKRKPGLTCTYCGDCIMSCKTSSIRYKFFKLSPENARNLYLLLTVTIHAVFLGLARM